MMFLVKTGFWLLVLILLLPTDEDQQNQIYGTAQSAVNDVVGFCDRNPETCATGQEAFAVLVQKAQYGAEVVMALIDEQTGMPGNVLDNAGGFQASDFGPVPMPHNEGVMPVPAATPLEPASWDAPQPQAAHSQDTLNPQDRATAWGGPGI